MGEKDSFSPDPYLILRSQQDPNYTHDYWGEEYFFTNRQKALQTIQTTKSSIVVLLIESYSQIHESHISRSNKRVNTGCQTG
jgi:hypothetical protein